MTNNDFDDLLEPRDLPDKHGMLNDIFDTVAAERAGLERGPGRQPWLYVAVAAAIALVLGGSGWLFTQRTIEVQPGQQPSVTTAPSPSPTATSAASPTPGTETSPGPTPTPTSSASPTRRTPNPIAPATTPSRPTTTPSMAPTRGSDPTAPAPQTSDPEPAIPPSVTYRAGGFLFAEPGLLTWDLSVIVCPGSAPEQLSNGDLSLELDGGATRQVVAGVSAGPAPAEVGRFTTCQEIGVGFTDVPDSVQGGDLAVSLSDGVHKVRVFR